MSKRNCSKLTAADKLATPVKPAPVKTKFSKRPCLCNNDDCFGLLSAMAECSESYDSPYVSLPKIGTGHKDADEKFRRRSRFIKHMDANNTVLLDSTSRYYIAKTHFHPSVLLLSDGVSVPHTITIEEGKAIRETSAATGGSCNFAREDLTVSGDAYIAVPNCPFSFIREELFRCQVAAGKKASPTSTGTPSASTGTPSASSAPSAPSAPMISSAKRARGDPRPGPEERSVERCGATRDQLVAQVAAMREAEEMRESKLLTLEKAHEKERRRAAAALRDSGERAEELSRREAFLELRERQLEERDVRKVGLTRDTATNDKWHENNPSAAKELYGFSTWKETKVMLWCFWSDDTNFFPPDHNSRGFLNSMTPFEKCLITKMRLHRAFTETTLALIWGRDRSRVNRYVDEWKVHWKEVGKDLSILEVDGEFLDATLPREYRAAGFLKICAVPDGKDFAIETPRSNSFLARACFSDKIKHSAFRCITWSTPSGLTIDHTDMFLGRCPEKKLVELWSPRFVNKFPQGYAMLSDRGFAGTAFLYPNFNTQLVPSFLKGREQFDREDLLADIPICRLRYTCEVLFSRVTNETILCDTIKRENFALVDTALHWAHAAANLCKPLQR